MKKKILFFLLCGITLLAQQSCVDTSYDDYDTSGVFNLGSFPIGNVDTIKVESASALISKASLDLLPITLPAGTQSAYGYADTIDIFNEDVIDQFFFTGAEPSLISDTAKVNLGTANSNIVITTYVRVLDADKTDTGILFPAYTFVNAQTRKLEIKFESSDMPKMQNARYMEFIVVFSSGSPINANSLVGSTILFRSVKLNGKVYFT